MSSGERQMSAIGVRPTPLFPYFLQSVVCFAVFLTSTVFSEDKYAEVAIREN